MMHMVLFVSYSLRAMGFRGNWVILLATEGLGHWQARKQ